MKNKFDQLSKDMSRMTTQRYSTSFSLGIRFLQKELRDPIYSIYGFVRFADEIVDSFNGFNKEDLLERFTKETYMAIEEGISLNPILNSFQEVVNKYQIPLELINTFLKSMEMDLDRKAYNKDSYDEYILGGNPLSTDTDGDCILDQIEVAWAQTTALDPGVDDVSPYDAINMADADGDGINEADALGCDLGGITPEPTGNETNNTVNESLDDDGDGISDTSDDCTPGQTGWISSSTTDHDGDGCQDNLSAPGVGEDLDDDNDGLADNAPDFCQTGDLGWISSPSTDYDGDGCRDAGEDNDDDSDDKKVSFRNNCRTPKLHWPATRRHMLF